MIKYENLPVLEGTDFTLRPIKIEDTDLIVKWRNSEAVKSRFIFRSNFTKEMHLNWLETKVFTGDVVQYIIEYEGTPVGSVYYQKFDDMNSSAEFGIFIGETFCRGKGLGGKVTKTFKDFGHKQLGLHRVYLRVLAENIVAYKTYRKAGFNVDGIFRDMVKIDDKYCDVIFMSSIEDNN